jgi:hypothetical protein
MADKYIELNAGRLREKEAIDASTGAGDAGKLIAADADGLLDESFLPAGIGADVRLITASETLDAGDIVNIHNDGGPRVRKADATTAGKETHGFVLDGFASSATATVYFTGILTGLTGRTPGARQYMSTTAGDMTETAPSTAANIVQKVGIAVAADAVAFNLGEPVELA